MDDLAGKIVILTIHADVWFRKINPNFNIPMVNRIAKVVKVFDWDTEEGKLLLEMREKNGKWKSPLDPKEFKYVLKIYYPELQYKDKKEVIIEEVLPKTLPGTKCDMFIEIPEWMFKDLQKEEKDIFKVVRKE